MIDARGARRVAGVVLLALMPRTGRAAAPEPGGGEAPRLGVELTTGKTFRDTYAALAVVQPKPFGTASEIGGVLVQEQRGYGGRVFVGEALSPRAWAFGSEVHFMTANVRFEPGPSWWRSDVGGAIAWRAPRAEDTPFGFQMGFKYARELLVDASGPSRPPDGHFVGTFATLSFDRSSERGLVSRGVHVGVTVAPGIFLTAEGPQSRHAVEGNLGGELAVTSSVMLAAYVVGAVSNRGNPNHSWLLGSISGVRGLDDSLYRNWWQVHGSTEILKRVQLSPDWQIEGALFGDGAGFAQLTPEGGRGATRGAIAAGVGLRVRAKALLPTIFRLDGSRLFAPYEDWFIQLGLSPYF